MRFTSPSARRVSCLLLLTLLSAALVAQERVEVSAPIVREAVTPNQLNIDLRTLTMTAPAQVWNVGVPVRVMGDLREDNAPAPPTSPPPAAPMGPAMVEEPPAMPPTTPPGGQQPPSGTAPQPVAPNVNNQDLRDVPPSEEWRPGDAIRIIPDLREDPPPSPQGTAPAVAGAVAAVPAVAAAVLGPVPVRGAAWDGISATGSLPPDTNGDVGPNHYIQIVNTSFAIYNKSGALLAGPLPINSLWSTFGGPCQTNNNGDPVVRYDALANRWLISQFALPAGTKYECVAISRTGDPVSGGWFLYAFPMIVSGTAVFPDYPKIGVWPDGYYMGTQRGFPSGGLDVWAFERSKMLTGAPAKQVQFAVSGTSLFLLPSDLEGPAPPAGSPNYFVRQVDGHRFGGADRIDIFAFRVDWVNTAASTFTQLPSIPVATFNSILCTPADLLSACIPQPGTAQKLESLTVWTMFRAAYRNFAGREVIVTNHTVNANGAGLAGVRWYELRRTGGGAWTLFQQGTFAPDATHRWMGSAAMDKAGNIAVGYSVSSSSVFPGIRAATRAASDPPGTLTEMALVNGGGSQTHSAARWGNYSSMDVDPVNDCTFWYTTEYYSTTSAAGWRTRIESFTMPNCGGVQGGWNVTNLPVGTFAQWSSAPGVKRLTGDFNRDGRTDIALTGPSGWTTLPVAFSNGNGSFNVTNMPVANFGAWASSPGAQALTGDFNFDGRTDIALTGVGGWTTLPVAFSNGNGTFNVTNLPIVNFGLWASSPNAKLLVGDYNADGRSDIAVTGVTGWGSVPVAFSNGNGSFNVANQPSLNFAGWSAAANVKHVAADFNGDGRTDIALTGGSGWTTMPVAFSNGNGTFSVSNTAIPNFNAWSASPNVRVIPGRFNNDNRADIALTGPSGWTTLPVAFSNGNGSFNVTNAPIANFGTWASSGNAKILPGNYDSGGLGDIAITGPWGWATIPVAFSNGNGTFNVTNQPAGTFPTWAASASVVALTGDFDGNGKTDIALTGPYSWSTIPIAFSISP